MTPGRSHHSPHREPERVLPEEGERGGRIENLILN